MEKQLLTGIAAVLFLHVLVVWYLAFRNGSKARSIRQPGEKREDTPFVSVILPAWQEAGTIEGCIEALQQVEYPAFEVIIVSGGQDGTFELAQELCKGKLSCHVIEQTPSGKSAALNQGVSISKGEILVFLDADTLVTSEWLKELVSNMRPSMMAATGNYVPLRVTPISLSEKMESISAYEIHNGSTLLGCGTIGLCRDAYETIGGLPVERQVADDWALDVCLQQSGIPRRYCADAVVYTERPATFKEFWDNEVRWRRFHIKSLFLYKKHFLKDVKSSFMSLYIYGLAVFTIAFTLVTPLAAAAGLWWLVYLWAIFLGWLILRRAALAIEVTAFRHEMRWMKLAWVPSLLLFPIFMAIVAAIITIKKDQTHFKGPRISKTWSR